MGLCCAWRLSLRGHAVQLIDAGSSSPDELNGSQAALGVLMARVFHRSSGRGWRLRQQSLELWSLWRLELASRGLEVPWRQGLLLLAADAAEQERHQLLISDRRRQGLGLELWDQARLESLQPTLPPGALSGLHSTGDGQLDPGAALEAIASDAARLGMATRSAKAVHLEPGAGGWRLLLTDGGQCQADWVVLAGGLGLEPLLASLGQQLAMEPVLGQALELERTDIQTGDTPLWGWPGVVHWQGANLIPRPDRPGGDRFWLGATLEPGQRADDSSLESLRNLQGTAPPLAAAGPGTASLAGAQAQADRPAGAGARPHRPQGAAGQRPLPQRCAAGAGHGRLGRGANRSRWDGPLKGRPLKPAAHTPRTGQGWPVKVLALAWRDATPGARIIFTIGHLDTPPMPQCPP